eukprot:TRINITY_DN19804_c0_g1_i1.p3 TRINITY_DN19804_c0_g1~~TRINITY_DN19804_c0_g1_i1.p3  ORF type:complete len:181 (-),score=31.75 TRINITY_DN19804_c0_g1_i1:25-567(-)
MGHVEFDANKKEYQVILPKNSDGVRISGEVKSKKKNNDKNEDNYVIRIFTSNNDDAKAYETEDNIYLYDDYTTLYIRTYKSEDKFKELYYEGDVTNCVETYKLVIKKEEALDENNSSSSKTTGNIVCLLYTSDAADDTPCVDLGGRRIIKKKKQTNCTTSRQQDTYSQVKKQQRHMQPHL